jgi:hypothetical protein
VTILGQKQADGYAGNTPETDHPHASRQVGVHTGAPRGTDYQVMLDGTEVGPAWK